MLITYFNSPIQFRRLAMSTPNNDTTTTNEGHDGFVWSQRLRVVYALLLAAVFALALAAPAFAEGAIGFGK